MKAKRDERKKNLHTSSVFEERKREREKGKSTFCLFNNNNECEQKKMYIFFVIYYHCNILHHFVSVMEKNEGNF